MNRLHIHMCNTLPEGHEPISGMRASSDALVYINMEKAMEEGIQFYKSANGVILSSGNANGFIKPHLLTKITDRHGRVL